MTQYERNLESVKENGFELRFIDNQTAKICLEAVKTDPLALQFVKEQTPKLCLAAVQRDCRALEFVKDQTQELCLEAIKKSLKQGHNISIYIKNVTLDILEYLIKNNIKFDLRKIKNIRNLPDDLKLLLILNYGISPSRFK